MAYGGGMPQVDFSIIGDLGKTYDEARLKAGRERSLAALGQGASIGDVSKALFQAGDVEGGMSLAQLGMRERGVSLQEQQASPGYIEKIARLKAGVEQEFAPKTTNIKTPGGEEITVEKGPKGYTVPQVQGMPAEPAIQYPPGVDKKAYREARSKQLGNIDDKGILEADKAVQAGSVVQRDLSRALELNKNAYSGPFAGDRGYIASQFGGGRGVDTEELKNVVTNQALENLRAVFGGNPTEGERKILLDVQGAASQAPEVRERIYKRAMLAAAQRTEFNKKNAEEMRSGQYLLPQSQRQPAVPAATPPTQAAGAGPPPQAVARLKANPREAEQFDEVFGVGAAAKALGVMR